MEGGAGADPGLDGLKARVEELEAEAAAGAPALAGAESVARAQRLAVVQATEVLGVLDGRLRAERGRAARLQAKIAKAKHHVVVKEARLNGAWRDWAGGLPSGVLARVANNLVAQARAAEVARLKMERHSEEQIQQEMAKRHRGGWRHGRGLFVFAMVCKGWRKVQIRYCIGRKPHSRVVADVIAPGQVALVKWALADRGLRGGCPSAGHPRAPEGAQQNNGRGRRLTMAAVAAQYGHLEVVKWLCGEGGFAMDGAVMTEAVRSGNLELVKWLRREGCKWGGEKKWAARKLGYTDNFIW